MHRKFSFRSINRPHRVSRTRFGHGVAEPPFRRRLTIEPLECRNLLTVNWDGGGDGVNWTDPLNWSANALPGSADDVVIDVPGTISVTKSSGTTTIRSLTCQEDLTISGGTLTVTNGASVVNGSFTMSGGTLQAVDTATFTANGATSLAGANLEAWNGADLVLPNATSYTAAGLSTSIYARDPGSTVDLSGVTSITGATGSIRIEVYSDGTVDVSSLTTLTARSLSVVVDGTVDLSALASWSDSTFFSSLYLTGGTVLSPLLASFDGVDLTFHFFSASIMPLSQITSVQTGSITSLVSLTFPNLTDITDSYLYSYVGVLALPAVTTYGTSTLSPQAVASGSGAKIDLSSVTAIAGPNTVAFVAQSGGIVDVSSLSTINSNSVLSRGVGSEVDLSGLTSWNTGYLSVRDGGSVTFSPGMSTLSGVSAALGGVNDITGWTLTAGTLAFTGDAGISTGGMGTATINANLVNSAVVGYFWPSVASNEQIAISGDYTQTAAGTFAVALTGPAPGTGYNQLQVQGAVTLDGTFLLRSIFVPYAATVSESFVIIDNDGTDPVVGTFAGLAEGAYVTLDLDTYQISYAGGTDNNDVVLTRVDIAPIVDLNGAATGLHFSTTWTNTGAVSITDGANATVGDGGSSNIISLTAAISGFQSGGVLSASTSGTPISASYNAGSRTLTLSNTATAAQYQQVLRTIKYNNTLGGPSAGSFTVNFVATDASGSGSTAVATVSVAVPPRVDLNGNQIAGGNNYTSTWSNLGAVNIADPFVGVVFDGQSSTLTSMTATLASLTAGDMLSATTAGGISISYDATNGILKMSGNATQANYQTVLRSVKYNNTSGPVNVTSKTVNFVGTDAISSSPTAVATINIQPLRLDLNGDLALGTGYNTFWSNVGAVNITGSAGATATTLVDGKAANLTSATATIVGVHAGDVLTATAAGGITVSYDSGNHVLNMTGSDTVANYQTVLRSVKYDNTSGGPGTSPITVNFLATDTLSNTSAASSTAQIVLAGSQVVARQLFYNQSGTASPSRYDGNSSAINSLDDNAIALEKVAYIPSAVAVPSTFANVSSYSKGINGLMIDLAGTHGTIEASDFIFRVGNNNTPGSAGSSWATAPAPSSISVRAGAGVGGSDRIEIVWTNGAIVKKWLQVVMKTDAGTGTGLAHLGGTYAANYGDVFYFGNALADSGLGDSATLATVDTTDELEARNHPQTALQNVPITNIRDYNRDAIVDTTDALLARNNATTGLGGASPSLRFINLAAGSPPNAPEGDSVGGDDGGGGSVPSAFAMTSDSSSTSVTSTPTWLTNSLSSGSASTSVNGGVTGSALLQLLGEEDSPNGDEDDDPLTSLLADLGME